MPWFCWVAIAFGTLGLGAIAYLAYFFYVLARDFWR